jgi:hypothetical protein
MLVEPSASPAASPIARAGVNRSMAGVATPMGWFRANRCRVAWLGLFALGCQLALAFGHVHLGKSGGVSDPFAIAANIDASSIDASHSAPSKKPTGPADIFCAVCAGISLAGTLVAPASPAVVPPISPVQPLRWSLAAIDPASFDHLLFDARGPPHA